MPAPFSESRRQRYRLHLQIGTALALGLVLVAFSLPLAPEAPAFSPDPEATPLVGMETPATDHAEPPPPPPPKPPPPREVADDEVVDEVIKGLDITFEPPQAQNGPLAPPAPLPPPQAPEAAVLPPPVSDAADAPDMVEFLPLEDQPVLIGGLEGLQRRVTYPEIAQRIGAEGKVFVRFIVDETGSVVEPEVLRSPHPSLSEAAIKAVSASRFTPGQQRGRPVRVRYTLPVEFVLR